MKQSIRTMMALGLLVLLLASNTKAARTSPTSEVGDQSSLCNQMAAEIKRLHLEIIEQAIEFQNWKLKQLERELLSTQSKLQHLREMESSVQQQIAGLEPQATHDLSSDAESIGELEIVKAAHTEDSLKPIQLKQQPLAEREAEISEEISREKTRLQELRQRAGQVRAAG